MKTICIIPARYGSKRIPRKNIKLLNGKPIINQVIKIVKGSKIFDKIIVSTESKIIARIVKKNNIDIHIRPRSLSTDKINVKDVIVDVIKRKNLRDKKMKICCVYPTSIFCNKKLLLRGKKILKPKNDFVFTAIKYKHPIQRAFSKSKNGVKTLFKNFENTQTQKLNEYFHDAAQFYFGWSNSWLNKKKIFTKKSKFIELNQNFTSDIDTNDDWKLIKILFKSK